MNVKENQQYQQTHQKIMDVMAMLLRQKPLKQITVAEICRAAHINRSTFYEHFLDTCDVVEKIEQGISAELKKSSSIEGSHTLQDVLLSFFRHIQNYQEFYAICLEQGLAMSVWSVLERQMRAIPQNMASFHGTTSCVQFEYAFEYYMSGIKALIFHWLKRDCRESPEELYDIYVKLTPQMIPA